MTDHRIVQCFGVKIRPHKPARVCRAQYMWSARGATAGNFGRKGAQACPHCGTMPDFKHPINRYLGGGITREQAEAMLEDYYAENPESK